MTTRTLDRTSPAPEPSRRLSRASPAWAASSPRSSFTVGRGRRRRPGHPADRYRARRRGRRRRLRTRGRGPACGRIGCLGRRHRPRARDAARRPALTRHSPPVGGALPARAPPRRSRVPDDSASVVWSLATVHHWRDLDAGLEEARRVLASVGASPRHRASRRNRAPRGHASHGWTDDQARTFAERCRAAGFADVEIGHHQSRPGRRVVSVLAHPLGR